MLTPWDDYPIHADADPWPRHRRRTPTTTTATSSTDTSEDGAFYLGGAMGHYPVLGVIDAAFSIVIDGTEHSVFASGRMPDRPATSSARSASTSSNRCGCCASPSRRTTLRSQLTSPGAPGPSSSKSLGSATSPVTASSPTSTRRLTQWGTWEGTVMVDGRQVDVDPTGVFGTRDRSWGMRGLRRPFHEPHQLRRWRVLAVGAALLRRPVHAPRAPRVPERQAMGREHALVPLLEAPTRPRGGSVSTTPPR